MSASETLTYGINEPHLPTPLTDAEINANLEFQGEALIKRRNELIAALQKDAQVKITDDEVLGRILENIRMAGALQKTGKERFTIEKEPFLRGGRVVDAWFRIWGTPLATAMEPVQTAMNVYGERKLELARAKALEAKRLADIEQERAAKAASEALRQGRPADRALDRVEHAAAAAEIADAQATARPADLTRTYGGYGAVGSVRQKWRWEVTDIALVPEAYLLPRAVDPELIKAAGKGRDASGKPSRVIPGITWVPETKMGVR